MDNQALPIKSVRDLSPLFEAFSEEDDEHGNPIFLYSSFGFITKEYIAYFGQSSLRKSELTPKEIKNCLKIVPDEDVYPTAPANVTVFATPLDSNVFFKGPKLNTAFLNTGLLPKLLLREAEIMETLMRNPHPNIVGYRGCKIERGLIVGLVLDRYPLTLQQRMKEGARHFNVENCMRKISSAVRHLHSLGLAHNDLTPMNIMIDEHDTPFVIDYGSCQPFGGDLITGGTWGWIDEDFTTSEQKHDEISLGKIQAWLEERDAGSK
ncbi:serine/threonine-protein kinase-like protein [Dendryphion nanum]|uniref:Serine/threonine-protein kinase-like protein n=1 Tax=Dendryphion nanum TaxID=256645 RepID=A0A9P9D0E3_9PLEO|nr:serine/threonine-protein kinase-like protein [Dendryphion nanum]